MKQHMIDIRTHNNNLIHVSFSSCMRLIGLIGAISVDLAEIFNIEWLHMKVLYDIPYEDPLKGSPLEDSLTVKKKKIFSSNQRFTFCISIEALLTCE